MVRGGEVELPGSVLERVGLQLPCLWPVQAFVLDMEALYDMPRFDLPLDELRD